MRRLEYLAEQHKAENFAHDAERFDAIDSRFDNFDQRFQSLDRQLVEIRSSIQTMTWAFVALLLGSWLTIMIAVVLHK